MNDKSIHLPTFIPLPEASARFNIPPKTLHSLINSGTLTAVQLPDGGILVDQNQVEKLETKHDIINRKFPHLVGHGITISQAADKYDVPRSTVEAWVSRYQYVSIVDDSIYPKLIDEADVAYCAKAFHDRQRTHIKYGVPLLDEEGLPILELKRPELSEYRRKKKDAA